MEKKKYQSLERNIDDLDHPDHFDKRKDGLKSTTLSVISQCLVTGAVMLSAASCGMPVGYSAILLPQLQSANETLVIDENIGSWIASIHSASTPLGSLLSGVLMDRFGRKLTQQIATVPLILGWSLIGLANSHALLLAGRLLAGMSAGLAAAPGQVLIGEISSPNLRGTLSSFPFVTYAFGILLVYLLGFWFHWRHVAGFSIILPVISALTFCFLPESPVWLVRQGKTEQARRNLLWLRGGCQYEADKELQELINRHDADSHPSATSSSLSGWRQIRQPEVMRPFIILNMFNLMQILSGTYLVVFYAVDILSTIGGSARIDNTLAAVLTAGIRFVFTIIASVLLGLVGRRSLAMTSGLGTAISALCLGMFLYLQSECDSGYFSAICLLIYVAANSLGFLILPGVLVSELYPARVRGLAGGLTFATFNLALFVVAKIFPTMKALLGVHGVFFLFGGTSLMACLMLYTVLPETRGKTLAEIEDYFGHGNWIWLTNKHVKSSDDDNDSSKHLNA